MRADRDFAQHGEPTAAGVDRRHAMCANRELLLVIVIEMDLHGKLAERLVRSAASNPGSTSLGRY